MKSAKSKYIIIWIIICLTWMAIANYNHYVEWHKRHQMTEHTQFLLNQLLMRGLPQAPNAKYGIVVDFSVDADQHRFFLFDMQKKELIYSAYTSHGSGSGESQHAHEFSNIPNSLKSSRGVLKTAETYTSSKHGYACKLDGLEPGINDNVRARGIILHQAEYVSPSYVEQNTYPGRSWGCITLDPETYVHTIDLVKGGSPVVIVTDENVDKTNNP